LLYQMVIIGQEFTDVVEIAMKLESLIERIEAKALAPGKPGVEIGRFYASARISDLLNMASGDTLLVSDVKNPQLLRVSELLEVPAICLLNDIQPDAAMLAAAVENGTALIVSPLGLEEACKRLKQCLGEEIR